MNIKEFLRPNIPKILIFLFAALAFLYFAKEDVCGAGFLFAFCYKSYGFPLDYLIMGDVSNSIGYVRTLPLGQFFYKTGDLLFNPAALAFDFFLMYILACIFFVVFRIRSKKPHSV